MGPEVNDHVSLQWLWGLWDSNRWPLENKLKTWPVKLYPSGLPILLICSNKAMVQFTEIRYVLVFFFKDVYNFLPLKKGRGSLLGGKNLQKQYGRGKKEACRIGVEKDAMGSWGCCTPRRIFGIVLTCVFYFDDE